MWSSILIYSIYHSTQLILILQTGKALIITQKESFLNGSHANFPPDFVCNELK